LSLVMQRLRRLRRKLGLAIAGLVGGYAVACQPAPEVPPIAPRPEPTPIADPLRPPKVPDPMTPAPKYPPEDARLAPPPITMNGFLPAQTIDASAGPIGPGPDGGMPFPPIPDANVPADAGTPVSGGGR
jgi:hypothetical protein